MPHIRRHSPLGILLALTRPRITIAVTFTTATGYLLEAGRFDTGLWITILGMFLLASGSSALNQWQERRLDALMARTKVRPIPAGLIDRTTALFVAILLMLLGLCLLASVGKNTYLLLSLGLFSGFWYNAVYTYLKRVTAFAVVPGALIGALPPIMGCVAAGGDLTSPLVLLVAMFFFVWQIPHFWLLLLVLGDQYDDAGLPTLTSLFAPRQLLRVTFMWLMATAAAGLVFPTVARGDVAAPWSLAIVIASLWLAVKAVAILRPLGDAEWRPMLRRAFVQVNAYALVVMVCLSLNSLVS